MRKGAVWLAAIVLSLSACGADDDDSGGAGGGTAGSAGTTGTAGGGPVLTGECMGTNAAGLAGPALHAAAATALGGAMASCSSSASCHQGTGKAKLVLKDKPDMRALMVNVMSCEAPNMPLVDGRGNETALKNSWLFLKLTAPLDSSSNLMANPAWGTPGNCQQMPTTSYGVRMPFSFGATMTWNDVPKIKDWICAGAPGPQ